MTRGVYDSPGEGNIYWVGSMHLQTPIGSFTVDDNVENRKSLLDALTEDGFAAVSFRASENTELVVPVALLRQSVVVRAVRSPEEDNA